MKTWMILLLAVCNICCLPATNKPEGLVCNLLVRPELTVITTAEPQFGWALPAGREYEKQTAYRILVASSVSKLNENTGDMWDSGKQVSDRSQNVRYKGKELQPQSKYYWKVAVWNGKGEESPFSDPQRFNTGEFGRNPAWPGESRWVKMEEDGDGFWTFEDRNPIRYHTKYPRKILQKPDGTWFIDFGRSSFSYATFRLHWPETASNGLTEKTITIRIGEKAIGDSIDRRPGGGVLCREYPLTIRPGNHEYTLDIPRFVSHYPHSQVMPEHMREVIPFRYCEVECGGAPLPPAVYGTNLPQRMAVEDEGEAILLLSVSQHALHTVFNDKVSSFTSSSEMLNDVYDLCKYSIKVNTFNGDYAASQRERMMYEADSYIHQMGHYAVDREFSVARYSLKNMIFHATWPTEWISQTILMAWADYLHTGNKDVISEFYDELTPKTLTALTTENDLISTRTGLQNEAFLSSIRFNGKELRDIVDWPQGSMSNALKGGETDDFDFRDYNTVVNAFHYRSLLLMAEMAAAVAKKQDAAYYTRQAAKVKKAFNRSFFDKARGVYVDGIGTEHASLHSNMFALAFGLVPGPAAKASVVSYIKSKGMACGVYGAHFLLEALFDTGEADYALSLMTATTDRSWYNMIRVGSTMTTEAWDNKYKTNNGWSHAWSSSPAHILPRKLVGIEPLTPGFETFRVKPAVTSLDEASATLPTIRGEIKAGFVKERKGFRLTVSVPGNTKARIYLPVSGEISEVFADGVLQKRYRKENQYVIIDPVTSGEHLFEIKYR
ncbi:MAG: alpha-L-rhamnosidase [Tannerella sp.]|jgi:hypothetical protein|nr:alpha-L-rhamnosidase [Tannerella sp.]